MNTLLITCVPLALFLLYYSTLFFFYILVQITVPGGLTLREGTRIIERVFESGRLCGLDIAEICTNIGDARDVKTTIDSAIHLINAATGNRRSGNLPPTHYVLPKN